MQPHNFLVFLNHYTTDPVHFSKYLVFLPARKCQPLQLHQSTPHFLKFFNHCKNKMPHCITGDGKLHNIQLTQKTSHGINVFCSEPQRFIYTPNTKYLVQNSTKTKYGMSDLINLFDFCKYCKYQKHVSKEVEKWGTKDVENCRRV